MNKLAYISLETSGINPQDSDIICYSAMIEGDEIKIFHKLAKPRFLMKKSIEQFVGISNEELQNCEESNEVKKEFLSLIKNATIVGKNLKFYESFLGVKFPIKLDIYENIKNKQVELKQIIFLVNQLKKQKIITTATIQKILCCDFTTTLIVKSVLVDEGILKKKGDKYLEFFEGFDI